MHEFAENTGIQSIFVDDAASAELDDAAKTVLFRIAQEALTNIKRHAGATEVKILLSGSAESISMKVIDNGGGFDVAHVAEHPKRGIGLRNMAERLDTIGGTLSLSSCELGTEVTATIPKA